MTRAKEKTALSPSVGADGGQPDQVINNSISAFTAEINHQIDNSAESLDEACHQLHGLARGQKMMAGEKSEDKKFYWLKLKRDFFKRHDIRIIEAMPNGKDYILFYLKLLCESVDHDGSLRFNEQIPYNEQMLGIITNTNIDIVRSAIKVFAQLRMMEILDDGTYHMAEVQKMLGSETYWAQKKREQRARLKAPNDDGHCPAVSNESPTCPSKSKSKSKSKSESESKSKSESTELELEEDVVVPDKNVGHTARPARSTRFVPPTVDEVQAYCFERGNNVNAQRFVDYYSSIGWHVGQSKMKDWKAAVRNWEQKDQGGRPAQQATRSRSSNPFLDALEDGIYD